MSEKVKIFLTNKQIEYEKKIKKLKKKNIMIKTIYGGCMFISITSSIIISSLTPIVALPMIAISILGLSGALASGLSIKFNIKEMKDKLEKNIINLNRIKNKLEYILSCNGDLNDEEHKNILKEFDNL